MRAAQLAHATNRTLVLPPVLPHTGDAVVKFPQWSSRAAGKPPGALCNLTRYQEHQQEAIYDVQKALQIVQDDKSGTFPSFKEVIDFSVLEELGLLRVIDMPALAAAFGDQLPSLYNFGKNETIDLTGAVYARQGPPWQKLQ